MPPPHGHQQSLWTTGRPASPSDSSPPWGTPQAPQPPPLRKRPACSRGGGGRTGAGRSPTRLAPSPRPPGLPPQPGAGPVIAAGRRRWRLRCRLSEPSACPQGALPPLVARRGELRCPGASAPGGPNPAVAPCSGGDASWSVACAPPTGPSRGYLVDSASSHMLVSKIKPCMSKYKHSIR